MFLTLFIQFSILFIILGFILIIFSFYNKPCDNKIIYQFIPHTFNQTQDQQLFVSDIFKTMFTEKSPWVTSGYDDYYRKSQPVNQYYVSQY